MSAKLLTDFNGKPNKTSIRCWNLKVDGDLDFSNAGNTQTLSVTAEFITGGVIKFTGSVYVTMTKIGSVVICEFEEFAAYNTSGENFTGTVSIKLDDFDVSYFPVDLVFKTDITAYNLAGDLDRQLAIVGWYMRQSPGPLIQIVKLSGNGIEVPINRTVAVLGKTLIWRV